MFFDADAPDALLVQRKHRHRIPLVVDPVTNRWHAREVLYEQAR